MEYRVEALARAGGVTVDTVRFYQGRGLIPPPRRQGRVALYGEAHLDRLRQVRALLQQGFSLAQIRRVVGAAEDGDSGAGAAPLQAADAGADAALLAALARESVGERSLSLPELAAESGVPEAILGAARSAGLLEPVVVAGDERYSAADLEMARAGLAILEAGLPLDELLNLAVTHARSAAETSEAAIDLFDDYVRKDVRKGMGKAGARGDDAQGISEAFRLLLPQVTRLVALHFQRTLVNRAIERMRAKGEAAALESAIASVESSRLEIQWR
ncbi:MAG: MerR family transcriptional regulator [Deltaproteobacteria bacterium]|nr:MerR family transcriptional regulator [Deltaproteobacteria bacterium]